MGFLFELWDFISARRKFWMVPILFMLILIGGLLLAAKGSAVAPFIYTLF